MLFRSVFTTSVTYARRMLELGYDFVTAGTDFAYVRAGGAAVIGELTPLITAN